MKNRFTRPPLGAKVVLSLAALLLTLSSCRSDALGPTLDLENPVDGELVVEPADLLLSSGGTGFLRSALRATSGIDLFSFPGSQRIEWSSDAPAIASVSAGGAVTAKVPGEARITATLDGKVASAFVYVLPTATKLRPMMESVSLGTIGATLRDSVGVSVTDDGGLPVPGVEVSFHVEAGGGLVSPSVAITDAAGIARFRWRLGNEVGLQAVRADADGVPAVFLQAEAEPTSDKLRLELLEGNEQEGEVDAILDQELSVQVVDQYGNPVSGQTIEWEFEDGSLATSTTTGSDGSGLPLTSSLQTTSGTSGISQVRWRLGPSAGTQRVTASLPNLYSTWFEAKAKAATARTISITPSVLELDPGRKDQMVARVRDQHGNVVNAEIDWTSSDPSVASVSSGGQVTALQPGTTQITAKARGVQTSSQVRVASLGASRILRSGGNNQSASVGAALPTPIRAKVIDSRGVGVPNVTVTWRVVNGGGQLEDRTSRTNDNGHALNTWVLGSAAGVQRASATAAGLQAVTYVATGQAAAARSVQVLPATMSLQIGDERKLHAQVLDARGNPVPGQSFTWRSSNPGIVRVGPRGGIDATGSGQAVITASSGGLSGSTTITVGSGVNRVTVSAPLTTLTTIGQSIRLTAQAYAANGQKLSGLPINWNSTRPSVATVNAVGTVTARANGETQIRACAGNACDQVELHVDAAPPQTGGALNSVKLTTPSTTISVGESVTLSAEGLDNNGKAVSGVSWQWSSSNAQVLTVSSTGVAKGVSSGTARITARGTSSGVSKSATIELDVQASGSQPPPPPPPPPSGSAPQMPQSYVNTSYSPPSGNTIRVRQGDDLQAKINGAQRGDILLLDANATFRGNFTLPKKSGSGWIVITTNTNLPPQGVRVTPQSAGNFARIVSNSTVPALSVEPGASQYRIMGVELTVDAGVSHNWGIVKLGETGGAQNTLAEVPRDIILDRLYIHAPSNLTVKRCVTMNASPAAVIDSYLSQCHAAGQDSQAILAWNAPGPFKIVNNYLEGAGENVMFGGADPSIPGLVPSDIEIRRNHFFKPLGWRNSAWTIKNHLELKMARRVIVEGNVMENNWVGGQVGFSILLQSLNQDGTAPQAVVEHVTIRNNLIRNVSQGFNLLARFKATPAQTMNNVLIEHNVIDKVGAASTYGGTGRAFQVLDDVRNLTIRNNTFFGGQAGVFFDGTAPTSGFRMQSNIVGFGQAGVLGSNLGEGTPALNHYAPGGVATDNVFIGGNASVYPSGNHFPSNLSAVGFVNPGGGNYQLSANSPFQGRGANMQGVNSATAGVR